MKNWFLLSLGFLMFSSMGMAAESDPVSAETQVTQNAQSSEKVVVREIARRRRHRRHRRGRHHRRHHRHHYRW